PSAVSSVRLMAFLAHEVHGRADEVEAGLHQADAAILSMVNVETDAARLGTILQAASPSWVFPIHCEPELLTSLRLGKRDISFLHRREELVRVARALEAAGIRCAPVPAAILAVAPRMLHLAVGDETLAALRPYAAR